MSLISPLHQLSVPRALLRVAGFTPGDVVRARRTRSGRVELVTDRRLRDGNGEASVGYPPGYLEELRSAWS